MKITKACAVLAALGLLVGCNRNSESSGAGSASDSDSQSMGQGANSSKATSPDAVSSRDGDTNASSAYEPDNTGRNERDRSDATLTPGDQGGSDADREITRRIRRAITANDQLSATAGNIKIITVDGKVTLRGLVKNEREKRIIDSIVRQAGVASVDDQLELKTTNQ